MKLEFDISFSFILLVLVLGFSFISLKIFDFKKSSLSPSKFKKEIIIFNKNTLIIPDFVSLEKTPTAIKLVKGILIIDILIEVKYIVL